jgi:hypothetical protein
MRRLAYLATLVPALFLGFAASSSAAVIQTFGTGSAVSVVEASAEFEDIASLGVSYTEDGIDFTRVNISTDNNGCGFAGCVGQAGLYLFTGNYFYGSGQGYISIEATGGNFFTGLEFMSGTGFFAFGNSVAHWEAYRLGVLVGSGTFDGLPRAVGFSDASGFDELRYWDEQQGFHAPAIDNVTAQYTQQVPEPASLLLLGAGVVGVARRIRRRA